MSLLQGRPVYYAARTVLARLHRSLVAWLGLLALALASVPSAGAAPLPGDDLYAVATPDGRRVVAVGAYGAIRVSTDGGESWRAAASPVDSTLTSVSLADAEQGWAVGMDGVLLRTVDGGAHWTRQDPPAGGEALHLLGVHALDAQRALAVGSWGARLRTDDGGRSWTDDPMTLGPGHPRFAWLDPAERARVRRGGAVREDVALQSVICRPGTEHCVLVGEFGTLQLSRDGGRSWRPAAIRAPELRQILPEGAAEAAPPPELRALAAALAEHPAAVLEVEAFASPGEIGARVRGGQAGPLFELIEARLDAGRGAAEAAGADAALLRAAGRPPWQLAEFGGAEPGLLDPYLAARRAPRPALQWALRPRPLLYDVVLVDEARAWAVGLGGAAWLSEDGGESWEVAPTPAETAFYGVAASGERVRAAGADGSLWSPVEGSAPASTPGRFLRDLAFAPAAPEMGFAVGEGGLVLRSLDGGRSWTRVAP